MQSNNIWFTSDHHFNHSNIIKYCERPFSSVHEMNETLIENWNTRIKKRDSVYHLGDFCFYGNVSKIITRLNGHIYLLKGNHDKISSEHHKHFRWIKDYYELKINKQLYVLCHYPMISWRRSNHGSHMIHGHCHGNIQEINEGTNRVDVSVDCNKFYPVNIEEIQNITKE